MVDGKDKWGGEFSGAEGDTVVPFSRGGIFGDSVEVNPRAEEKTFTSKSREEVIIDLNRERGSSTEAEPGVTHDTIAGLEGDVLSGSDSARGGLVAARGTVDGLVIRVDGRIDAGTMRQALDEFVSARSSFLSGQEVFLEWVGMRPSLDVEQSLTQLLTKSYGIAVKSVRLFARTRAPGDGSDEASLGGDSTKGHSDGLRSGSPHHGGGSSLFGGVRSIGREGGSESSGGTSFASASSASTIASASTMGSVSSVSSARGATLSSGLASGLSSERSPRTFQSPLSGSTLPWDEPDTRLIHATLRSGQKLESEHSLVIVGDVNSGAEVISGGDIVILGTLRGVAHAGAYEESGGGRVIFSLNMQPTQLRIGAVISRGQASEVRTQDGKSSPEVARVDGSLIVVEPYHTKTVGAKSAAVKVSPGPSTVGLLGRKRGAA